MCFLHEVGRHVIYHYGNNFCEVGHLVYHDPTQHEVAGKGVDRFMSSGTRKLLKLKWYFSKRNTKSNLHLPLEHLASQIAGYLWKGYADYGTKWMIKPWLSEEKLLILNI